MNKLMLCAVLILISMQGKLYAQESDDDPLRPRTATERIFNPSDKWNTRYRDFVDLKECKMILDIARIADYTYLAHMDSILLAFKRDIAFYQDSLKDMGTGHVRIDYVISERTGGKKIRFKKYNADGDIYVNDNGKVSRLKIEQDTVRIIIEKQVKVFRDFYEPYAVQATFLLNNYTDVDYIIAGQAMMAHVMDTLQQTKMTKHGPDTSGRGLHNWIQKSTCYKPYSTSSSFVYPRYKTIDGIAKNELAFFRERQRQDYLTIDFNIGAGLVRNTFAPSADLGLQIIKSWRKYGFSNDYNFGGLYFQPIFFFDRNSNGDFITNVNGFINFHYGAQTDGDFFGLKHRKGSFGIGYLVLSKGNYFKKNTFKLFSDLQLKNGFTLSPELIITDNGKQIFPGLTLKVF